MGIRLNRVAGYALTNVLTDEGVIDDLRLNNSSCFLDGEQNGLTKADHLGFLRSREDGEGHPGLYARAMLGGAREIRQDMDLSACVTFDAEYGDPSILVLTPPSELKKLIRRDDPIDYALAVQCDPNDDPAVVHLAHGVGLHYGELMDRRTGVQLCAGTSHLISSITEFPRLAEYYDLEGLPLWASSDATKTPVFSSCAEAVENVVPLVPASIRLLAEHSGLFTNPNVWKTLRPVVYTYWS